MVPVVVMTGGAGCGWCVLKCGWVQECIVKGKDKSKPSWKAKC